LTSIDRPDVGDATRIPVDLAAFLTKPIKQSHLYNVLNHILGEQPIPVKPAQASLPQLNPQLAAELPLRILIAEDNRVNQKVALHLLKLIGYRADVASDGLEVLEALHSQSYDVVLMDVQMPNMDGLATTRRICQEPLHNPRPRIIAVTANAMQGDREECLKAGMDDYISKPIRLEELIQALSKCQPNREVLGHRDWGLGKEGRAQEELGKQEVSYQDSGGEFSPNFSSTPTPPAFQTSLAPSPQPIAPIDVNVLQSFRNMVGEKADLVLAEMIDCYLEDAPKLISAIAQAVAQADAAQLRHASHTLKSSSATLGAMTLSHLCKKLEVMSRVGNTEYAEDHLPQLEAEYKRVRVALEIERQQKGLKVGKSES